MLGTVGKVAAVAGVAGVAVSAIAGMTSAAAEDAAEQERLAQAINAAGAATGDWQASVDAAIASGQRLAFTDTQIRDAMVPLVGATGDVTEANALLATAQDLARLKGVDLTTASEAVAKAHSGNETALARLIGVSGQGLTATETLAEAQRLGAGQAETYGASTAGSMEAASIGFSEVGETIGAAFLPMLQAILPVIIPLIEQIAELVKDLLPILTPLLKLAVIPLKLIATAISAVLDVLGPLLEGIGQAIDLFSDFLGSAGKASKVGAPGGPKGAARSVQVTVNTGADPDAVIRAIRKYAAVNGGSMGELRGWG
jgi:phage-related protein